MKLRIDKALLQTQPKDKTGEAIAYTHKNWTFGNSQRGAKAIAMRYSIIEAAKASSLAPYAYLRVLFTRLLDCETVDEFEVLLPGNVRI